MSLKVRTPSVASAWRSLSSHCSDRRAHLYVRSPISQMAMVAVARQQWEPAEHALRRGVTVQDGDTARRRRFPANGLHWLLGLIRMRQGDLEGAGAELQQELAAAKGELYAHEFLVRARTAR